MNNNKFIRKLAKVKERITNRSKDIEGAFIFPSMAEMMSEKDRLMVSEAQSRAMKKWWASLSADQHEEMVRRIKEGRKRASQERIAI